MDLNALDAHFILFLVYRSWPMQHSGLIWMHDHTEWYQTFACKYYVKMFLFVPAYIAVDMNDTNTTRWVTLCGFPDDMNSHGNWHLISMKQQEWYLWSSKYIMLWSSKYIMSYSCKCLKYMTLVHVCRRQFMIPAYQLLHMMTTSHDLPFETMVSPLSHGDSLCLQLQFMTTCNLICLDLCCTICLWLAIWFDFDSQEYMRLMISLCFSTWMVWPDWHEIWTWSSVWLISVLSFNNWFVIWVPTWTIWFDLCLFWFICDYDSIQYDSQWFHLQFDLWFVIWLDLIWLFLISNFWSWFEVWIQDLNFDPIHLCGLMNKFMVDTLSGRICQGSTPLDLHLQSLPPKLILSWWLSLLGTCVLPLMERMFSFYELLLCQSQLMRTEWIMT